MVRIVAVLLAFVLGGVFGSTVSAEPDRPDDALALKDLDEGRILWDITLSNPDALLSRLDVIEQTYNDLERQGVEPRMVFAFRGGAVQLLLADPASSEIEDEGVVEAVQEKLQELESLEGVERMEACSIATRRAGITQEDLVEPIVEVGNTFVTAAAYAQRGYANLKVD